MTFYEAALQILIREGKPLHATAITELAVKESLLSHVGRQPELTMASRLAAMARRATDRRIQAVEADVFGLVEWNVPAQPDALEQSGQPEPHDENEPPLRERERHPRVSRDHIRSTGRNDRRRRDEGERRRHQAIVQPLQELLDRVARWVVLGELAAVAREHGLLTEELATDALAEELLLENERREGEGKKPMFVVDGTRVCLRVHVEGAGAATSPIAEALAAAAKAVVEARAARPVEAPVAIAAIPGGGIEALLAAEEQRVLGQLRRRAGELDLGGFEALVRAVAAAMGYEDVRTARRGKEGPLLLAQRRMGVVPLRFVLKLVRGTRPIRREDVQEVRKDLQSLSAPMGVIFSAAEVTREARSEAQQGGGVVLLLCGDAFAAQLAEKSVGVQKRTVELLELDDAALQRFGRTAESAAPPQQQGRTTEGVEAAAGGRPRETPEERRERRDRERREWREQREQERLARRALALVNDAKRFWDPAPEPVVTAEPSLATEAAPASEPVVDAAPASEPVVDAPPASEPVVDTAPAVVELPTA